MSFAFSFLLVSLVLPLLVLSLLLLATLDFEMAMTSSCVLLAVSESSGGKCNFCKTEQLGHWHSGVDQIRALKTRPPCYNEATLATLV